MGLLGYNSVFTEFIATDFFDRPNDFSTDPETLIYLQQVLH